MPPADLGAQTSASDSIKFPHLMESERSSLVAADLATLHELLLSVRSAVNTDRPPVTVLIAVI